MCVCSTRLLTAADFAPSQREMAESQQNALMWQDQLRQVEALAEGKSSVFNAWYVCPGSTCSSHSCVSHSRILLLCATDLQRQECEATHRANEKEMYNQALASNNTALRAMLHDSEARSNARQVLRRTCVCVRVC